jgi:hypothetical protein
VTGEGLDDEEEEVRVSESAEGCEEQELNDEFVEEGD